MTKYRNTFIACYGRNRQKSQFFVSYNPGLCKKDKERREKDRKERKAEKDKAEKEKAEKES